MDSLTHIVLGGCIGEAVAGRSIGRKAMYLGAAAQSLPDIDFVASFWLNPANDLLAHRAFTHSFLFVGLASMTIALLADKYLHRPDISFRRWIWFFGLQITIHILLDACNAYGVGWFEPFSHIRIAFHILFVADPFLSVPIAVCFGFLALASMTNSGRRAMTWTAISWCVAYLGYGLAHKAAIDSRVQHSLREQGISSGAYFATPTPLNNWLWYVVVNSDSGSYVGYRSVFDSSENIDFEFFPRSESLLNPVHDHEDLQHLRRFSQGFYTVEKRGDTIVFNDLRFGQMIGWRDRRAKFVFQYYITHPDDNRLVIQRGRFSGWDWMAARSLLTRIRGD